MKLFLFNVCVIIFYIIMLPVSVFMTVALMFAMGITLFGEQVSLEEANRFFKGEFSIIWKLKIKRSQKHLNGYLTFKTQEKALDYMRQNFAWDAKPLKLSYGWCIWKLSDPYTCELLLCRDGVWRRVG